ncbi:MAG: hypothetical protein KBA06_04980 [Saprospiraceae bacterium]|nr:hypothetical protein [Saprospiraceae bacterium]
MDALSSYQDYFSNWKSRNLSAEEIISELREKIDDELHIQEIVKAYKKRVVANRLQTGFKITGAGSFLCFISCVLTMLNVMPEYRSFFLYGLTSIGASLILVGFYFIFEE